MSCGEKMSRRSISIHALRMQSDVDVDNGMEALSPDFNPRSAYAERHDCFPKIIRNRKFQSTLCVCRATTEVTSTRIKTIISIHALRMQSDALGQNQQPPLGAFQSTRQYKSRYPLQSSHISIHALRMQSDIELVRQIMAETDFNPRSAYAERPYFPSWPVLPKKFQSTLCVCRATPG